MKATPVDHDALGIVGYADPFVVSPGATVSLHASSTDSEAMVQLVRLGHDGEHATESNIGTATTITLRHEALPHGSWGEIPEVPVGDAVSLWVWIGRYPDAGATLADLGDLELRLGSDGRLRSGTAASPPLDLFRWYLVAAGRGWCSVAPKPTAVLGSSAQVERADEVPLVQRDSAPATLRLGVGFDGKIARPAVHTDVEPARIMEWAASPASSADASWDLAERLDTQEIAGALAGNWQQGPTRAVPGPDWNGTDLDWRSAPSHYDAVWLHTDDLIDASWPAATHVELAADTTGGAYGFRITSPSGTDLVPFFVRTEAPRADVAVLLPTLTYLAYANEHVQAPLVALTDEVAAPFARANHLLSWYDRHLDNSRGAFVSTKRPLLGVRPDHRFRYLGADHGLSADLALLGWLDRRGITYDVITDHQLDADAELPYRALVTGGHPEYWTEPMLDTLDAFLADGGRLAYLGGNGFLWSTAVDPARSWLAEMRRGQVENVPLDGEAGEDHLQLTGRPSGLWRTVGRPEAERVGVATTAMGFGDGVPYERTTMSDDARAARIFEGVTLRSIGAFGPKQGVVGYEVDFANRFLGTPAHALVVATAQLPEHFAPFAPMGFPGPTGENPISRRRADMVFFETASGGAVFSASTILWNQSLCANGDDNEVAQITDNVIRWFAEDADFTFGGPD